MVETITKNRTAIVKLNRQPANALDLCFLEKIYTQLQNLEKNHSVRCIVLTSECRDIFSSGLDLNSLTDCSVNETRIRIITAVWSVYKIVRQIINSKKIYIAALDGPVIGSAFSIAIACDFRLSNKKTWFWLPDPQYGGLLADGGIDIIKNIAGLQNARKICMSNQRINAYDAKKMGIVSKIIDDGNIIDAAMREAANILQYSFITLQCTKSILNKSILQKFQLVQLIKVIYSNELINRLREYQIGKFKYY